MYEPYLHYLFFRFSPFLPFILVGLSLIGCILWSKLVTVFVNGLIKSVLNLPCNQDSLVDERFQPVPAPSLSSFKRAPAPAMGGRAVEQRRQEDRRSRSKGAAATAGATAAAGSEKSSRGSSSKADRRVGQLDERNLKRAAHRYGTLPKGARIGAYLESLRASGLTPEPVLSDGGESGHDTLDSQRSGHTDPGPGGGRVGPLMEPPQPLHLHPVQPAGLMSLMARSNSSHGGFPGAASSSPSGPQSSQGGGHQSRPAGPRSGQLPRRLPTYTQGSTPLRGATSAGGKPSALLDLDFPPPPSDHPEESGGPFTASSFQPALLPSSPSLQQRLMRGAGGREPSPDSCSSLRSYSEQQLQRISPLPPQQEGPPASQHHTFTTFSHQHHQLVTEMMVGGGGGGATPPLPSSSPIPPSVDQVTNAQCDLFGASTLFLNCLLKID
jgi:hypothetical protein